MTLTNADTLIFITHALPLSNVFTIITYSASVVVDFRQNPPDLPCFKHQAAGAAAASSSTPPFSVKGIFMLWTSYFQFSENDDIRSLLSPLVENRAVQTEWGERIIDGGNMRCHAQTGETNDCIRHNLFTQRRETQQTGREDNKRVLG